MVFAGAHIKDTFLNYSQHLTDEFKLYFPNSCDDNIFRSALYPSQINIDMLPEILQEPALEIENIPPPKIDKLLCWIKYLKVNTSIVEQTLQLYLLFSSIYLCRIAFSENVTIRTKYRSPTENNMPTNPYY